MPRLIPVGNNSVTRTIIDFPSAFKEKYSTVTGQNSSLDIFPRNRSLFEIVPNSLFCHFRRKGEGFLLRLLLLPPAMSLDGGTETLKEESVSR